MFFFLHHSTTFSIIPQWGTRVNNTPKSGLRSIVEETKKKRGEKKHRRWNHWRVLAVCKAREIENELLLLFIKTLIRVYIMYTLLHIDVYICRSLYGRRRVKPHVFNRISQGNWSILLISSFATMSTVHMHIELGGISHSAIKVILSRS